MKYLYIALFLFVYIDNNIIAKEIDDLTELLNKEIAYKPNYDKEKEAKLEVLKNLLKIKDISLNQLYDINYQLLQEYNKYNIDSAIYYTEQNLEIAPKLQSKDFIIVSQLKLSLFYSIIGKYIESKDILDSIDRNKLSDKTLVLYYEAYSRFYEYYAQSNNQHTYFQINESYRDSLLNVIDINSLDYKILYAKKMLYQGQLDITESRLLPLIEQGDLNSEQYALVTYLLGNLYKEKNNKELQKKYYILSAICDMQNSIKENASMQSLALMYYDSGNIEQAYKLTKSAIDDAVFSNVRFRNIELSKFYSIINNTYLAKETKQKKDLQYMLICISILSIVLIITIIYIYKQIKRLSRIRKELYHTNLKLKELNEGITRTNTQLSNLNRDLSESNHIKEEYIAQFFDMCSSYINKIESYRKALNKKAMNHEMEDLFKMLKSNTMIDDELGELYRNFDAIFLNLYPTFVEGFNALLISEEQVYPKQGELLNTELRVFALIRLGITDSVKIASFLRYSLSTIYNYRTKARNKAVVSRDEFEKMIMEIGAIH